jgi:uncharacterized protein YjbI with pentapeptide repeats
MRAVTLVGFGVAMVAGALLTLLLTAPRHRRQQPPWILGPVPSPQLPDSRRRRLANVGLVRSSNVTVLGIGLGVALLVGAGLAAVFWVPQLLVPSTTNFVHSDRLKVVNDVRGTLLQAVAGLGAIIAAIRTWLTINERGQITERLTRAVDQLASRNPEVRLAGIFALEQIARDSDRDREAIVEILTGYVRTKSSWPPQSKSPWPAARSGRYRNQTPTTEVPALEVRAADVQIVMTVLTRGPWAGDRDRPFQLANVDLRYARLPGANLQVSVLNQANLQGARLGGAYLQRAHLDQANLQRANLDGAHLQDAYLSAAQLQEAHLDQAELQGAHLEQADLQGAHLEQAQLQGAVLGGAQLREARLGGAQLQKANLDQANLQGANLDQANLEEAKLGNAELQGAVLGGAQLREARLGGAQLQGALCPQANLQGADLSGAQLQGALLTQANLQGADLSGAQLQRAYLTQANLQDADLGDAELQGADLNYAQLRGANLQGADLSGARLQGADPSEAKLQGAVADEATMWPDGFDPAAQGLAVSSED